MAFDFIEHHRRALAGGTAALAILVVAWLATRHTDADPVLRDEPLTGMVRSVAAGAGISTCDVELASGARVRVACGTPAPRAGEPLALRALHHRSGAVTYVAPRASSGL